MKGIVRAGTSTAQLRKTCLIWHIPVCVRYISKHARGSRFRLNGQTACHSCGQSLWLWLLWVVCGRVGDRSVTTCGQTNDKFVALPLKGLVLNKTAYLRMNIVWGVFSKLVLGYLYLPWWTVRGSGGGLCGMEYPPAEGTVRGLSFLESLVLWTCFSAILEYPKP